MADSIIFKIKDLNDELKNMPGTVQNHDAKIPDLFDELIIDKQLKNKVEKLYRDGHHARAVEEAYKYIDNLVKKMSGESSSALSGSKLMNQTFSPANPKLKFN